MDYFHVTGDGWILSLAGAQQSSDSKRERTDEVNFVVVRQA